MTDALFNKAMENIKYQHKRSSTFQAVFLISAFPFKRSWMHSDITY